MVEKDVIVDYMLEDKQEHLKRLFEHDYFLLAQNNHLVPYFDVEEVFEDVLHNLKKTTKYKNYVFSTNFTMPLLFYKEKPYAVVKTGKLSDIYDNYYLLVNVKFIYNLKTDLFYFSMEKI